MDGATEAKKESPLLCTMTDTEEPSPTLEADASPVDVYIPVDPPRVLLEVGDVEVRGAGKAVRFLHRLYHTLEGPLLLFRTKVSEERRVKLHWILYGLYLLLVICMAYMMSLIEATFSPIYAYSGHNSVRMCETNTPAKIFITIFTINVSLTPLWARCCCGTAQVSECASHIKTSLRSKLLFTMNVMLFSLIPIVATLSTIQPCTGSIHDTRQVVIAMAGTVVAIITSFRVIFNIFCAVRFARDTKVEVTQQKASGVREIYEAFSDAHGVLFLKATYGLVQNVWSLSTFQSPSCGQICDQDALDAEGYDRIAASTNNTEYAAGNATLAAKEWETVHELSSLADKQVYVVIFIAAFGCAGSLLEFASLTLWGHGSGLCVKVDPKTRRNTIAVKSGMKLDCERRVSITEGGAGSIKFFINICILVTDLAVGLTTLCFGSFLSGSQLFYGILEYTFGMIEAQHILQTWLTCMLRRGDYVGSISGTPAANITVVQGIPERLVEYRGFKLGCHTAIITPTPKSKKEEQDVRERLG